MGRRMRPRFEEGKYNLGLQTGLQLFVDVLGQFSNFTFEALDRQRPNSSPPAGFQAAPPATANASFKPNETGSPKIPAATKSASRAPESERKSSQSGSVATVVTAARPNDALTRSAL